MKIIPKDELILLIDTLLYGNINDKEVAKIFEKYGDDYFPRCTDPVDDSTPNQNRVNLLKKIKKN